MAWRNIGKKKWLVKAKWSDQMGDVGLSQEGKDRCTTEPP